MLNTGSLLSSLPVASLLPARLNRAPPAVRLGTRPRLFSSTGARAAGERNHYEVLGVKRGATKKEIRARFYDLSRRFHPDVPSTSGESLEDRTARFQSLSESWAILSDDALRRQYDASLSGRSSPYGARPTYTSGPGRRQSGFGGGSAAAWSASASASASSSTNQSRREKANYAWTHPARMRKNSSAAAGAAGADRVDPFANRQEGGARAAADHFSHYHARDARARERQEQFGGGGVFGSGTAGFGAKAEEESRLINDSSVLRYGQVFLLFMGAFALSHLFSRRKHEDHKTNRR